MRYKTMKKSGEKISAITVGTWAIGGKNSMGGGYGEIDDQDSIEAIKAMIDGGVNLIDTAPIYGEGHSEEVVGKAIEGIRDKVLIATKYGSLHRGRQGRSLQPSRFGPARVRRIAQAPEHRLRRHVPHALARRPGHSHRGHDGLRQTSSRSRARFACSACATPIGPSSSAQAPLPISTSCSFRSPWSTSLPSPTSSGARRTTSMS